MQTDVVCVFLCIKSPAFCNIGPEVCDCAAGMAAHCWYCCIFLLLFSFVQALGKRALDSRPYNKTWQKTLRMAAKGKNVSTYMWLLVQTEGTWGCFQSTLQLLFEPLLEFLLWWKMREGRRREVWGFWYTPQSYCSLAWRWSPAGATQTRERRSNHGC